MKSIILSFNCIQYGNMECDELGGTFRTLCICIQKLCIAGHNEAGGDAVGWGTALQTGRSQIRFLMMSLEFFIDIILLASLWLWGRLSH
jgi:hypothetical protein